MTPGQKKNIERFKKAASEAKKIRKQNPKLSQGEAMKKAFATLGASKPAPKKSTKTMAKKSVTKKPATRTKIHKDTKSHNVNIRVVSGFSGTIYDAQKLRSEMLDKILKTKNYITEIQNVINEKSPAEKGSLRLTIAIHKRTIENYKKCIKTLDTIIAQNLK